VLTGTDSETRLLASGADVVVDSVADLVRFDMLVTH
jgi:hypothetical protein